MCCREQVPDLIVLDAEMPDFDAYQTCRSLREWTSIPIIFATAHQSLEEHLKAYDAGGSDLILKPVNSEILLRKVSIAIQQYRAAVSLVEEKEALKTMAMGFLSGASQSGTLLNFMRASIVSQDYLALAQQLLGAIVELGLRCCVQIKHSEGATFVTEHGDPSPLEISIFEHTAELGRLFQFKQHLVVNYDRISIVISNMPNETEDPERSGILRDSLAILAETAEALAVNVDIRQENQKRAEQMQIALGEAETTLIRLGESQQTMLMDTRLLLQELVDGIEKTYSWLNTSSTQEATINSTMEHSIQRILDRLASGEDLEFQFNQVIQALNAGRRQDAIELF